MSARLHLLLGSGGVGKTTLASAYALALAHHGRRVGLLGIDPSQRLQGALGVNLTDLEIEVPGQPGLSAAIAQPHQAIRRWVGEASREVGAADRLDLNPFFRALGDHLATATDVLSAGRIAEWAEGDSELGDLVVDTAPGLAAVDFLRSPRQIEALITGPLVKWLRSAARGADRRSLGLGWAGRRVLDAFARIAGTRMLSDFADFFALVRAPLERMLVRIEHTERWLAAPETELLLVTSPHDTEAAGARQLADALRLERLEPRAIIVNRAWPGGLEADLRAAGRPAGSGPLVDHLQAQLVAQRRAIAAAAVLAKTMVILPARPSVALADRAALVAIGTSLREALESSTSRPRPGERPRP